MPHEFWLFDYEQGKNITGVFLQKKCKKKWKQKGTVHKNTRQHNWNQKIKWCCTFNTFSFIIRTPYNPYTL